MRNVSMVSSGVRTLLLKTRLVDLPCVWKCNQLRLGPSHLGYVRLLMQPSHQGTEQADSTVAGRAVLPHGCLHCRKLQFGLK